MRLRTCATISTIVGVVAALMTASPAQARSFDVAVKSKTIAISSAGHGKVAVQCRAKRPCRGKISFADDAGKPRAKAYKVAAGKTAYVRVAIRAGAADNPHHAPAVAGRAFRSVSKVRLKVDEDSPRNRTHHYGNIVTETAVTRQKIAGRVTGVGAHLASDIRVELVKSLRGGNTSIVKGQDISGNGGSYSLSVNLGANNSQSGQYRLRISGKDQDGVTRSWYWRGKAGKPTGGGAHLRDGSVVRAKKYRPFTADFTYGSISGTTSPATEVTVASPPPTYGGGRDVLRELDIPSCANYFGSTHSDGSGAYTVGFLPVTASTNNRYLIGARRGSIQAWYGKTDTRFGSCHHATSYSKRRGNLLALTGPVTGKALSTSASGNTVKVKARYSSAYKATAQGDRWIRLREKVPGLKILDAPVVAEGAANSAGIRSFTNVRPGRYWVEVGRRTGCADWYGSKYTNNNKYFKGMDRGSERWKSFRRLRDLSGNAQRGFERVARTASPNPARGAEQNKIPRGYAGWMYRGFCKAHGAGTIDTMTVTGTNRSITKSTSRNRQGAVVKGRVKREGGRTNKEIMVRLSSSAGTRVIRTDLTDSSGTFYVAGLPSGRWTISVNSDSWRGIGRDFSGRHSITVKAGRGYNVGTLRFKN